MQFIHQYFTFGLAHCQYFTPPKFSCVWCSMLFVLLEYIDFETYLVTIEGYRILRILLMDSKLDRYIEQTRYSYQG